LGLGRCGRSADILRPCAGNVLFSSRPYVLSRARLC
jgi:hypothetical protein